MSFSSNVKTELEGRISNAKHCRVAEIAALISLCGNIKIDEFNKFELFIRTDTKQTAKKFKELLWKTFHIETEVEEINNPLSHSKKSYEVHVKNNDDSLMVLREIKLVDDNNEVNENLDVNNNELFEKDCCKRSYLRGSFMAAGSMTDPNKEYHLEIKCPSDEKAKQIIDIFKSFEINAKTIKRKEKTFVYIKGGENIVNALNVMEAPISLMEMENVIIQKDVKNVYMREINCEVANQKKTLTASQKVINDIKFIESEVGLSYLPEKLRQIATIRINNPQASLQELGDMMIPKLGKSGVNHRLRKISEIAEQLNNGTTEQRNN